MATAVADAGVAAPIRVQRRSWYILAVFCLLYVVSIIDRQVLTMAVPAIKQDLHLTDVQISLLVGPAFVLLYAVCGLPFGALSDRGSRRTIAWAGVTLWSVAASACGLASSFWGLFAARMGVGAGEASLAPAAYSTFSDIFPRRRLTLAASIFASSAAFGGSVALLLGGLLLAIGTAHQGTSWPVFGMLRSWQFAFLVTGLPGFLIAALVFTFPEPARTGRLRGASSVTYGTLMAFLRSRRKLFISLFAGYGFAGILLYGLLAWVPAHMGRQFGLSPARIGIIYGTISFFTGILSHAAKGWVIDWFLARGVKDVHFRIYVWCALVTGPIGIATFLTTSLPLFVGGLTITLFFLTPILGYASAAVQLVTPNELRGKMAALFIMVISGIGNGLGPVIVAAMTDKLFRSEAMLGRSIAVLIAICAIAASVILANGCQALREAMTEAESW